WDQWMETLSWRNLLHKGNEEEEGDRQGQLEYLTEEVSPAEAAANRQEDEAQPVQANIQIGPASMLELVNLSFETMQASLTKYKIAGDPPDVIFDVPKRLCRFFEFQRAPELIELGRMVASDTLDRFEKNKPMV